MEHTATTEPTNTAHNTLDCCAISMYFTIAIRRIHYEPQIHSTQLDYDSTT